LVRQFFSRAVVSVQVCPARLLQRLRRAPFPISVRRLRAVFDLFLFSLFTTLGVALYCTYVDLPDCIVFVLCIYLSFFLFTTSFFIYLVTGSARKLYNFFLTRHFLLLSL
jgi:hypothetical protein